MILTNNIRIGRIIKGTWKYFILSILASLAAYFFNDLWLNKHFDFPVFVPTVLGTALAFFIGFNNNQAYDRWWEARKIWGSLVNNSRTWARQVLSFKVNNPADSEEMDFCRANLVKRHIAFLYLLKSYLRNVANSSDHIGYLQEDEIEEISTQTNLHNAVLNIQARSLNNLYTNSQIDGFQFIEMNKMITSFCDDMGKSERIKNTVFPTTYNYYSKSFIWLFLLSATMSFDASLGLWAVAFGTLLGYVFFTIQAIGQALINPFEDIATGIPVDQITRTIEINLLEMLGADEIPAPVSSINGEYIM